MPRVYRTPILCYQLDGNCLCKLVKLWAREAECLWNVRDWCPAMLSFSAYKGSCLTSWAFKLTFSRNVVISHPLASSSPAVIALKGLRILT